MTNVSNVSNISNSIKTMPVITHNGVPVVTTETIASLYDTVVGNIKTNFSRNAKRFIEGKHYFKLTGSVLKDFKNKVTKSNLVACAKNAKHLTLWTERGAARHAKMLDTDNAWDVFEALEDFYFAKKEDAQQKISIRQSTAKELTPLRQTAERLIATGVANIYPDIWKYVHKEFGVEHINELLPEQIPQAISFLDALEGEYLPKQTEQFVNCRVLHHYDDKGAIIKSEIAADDEQLTSPKVFADLAESRGYVMVKKDDIYCDSTVRSNVNAAYGNFKILKEIWYEKINPFLSTFSPEISSQVSGAMGNVDGPIYLAKLSLTPKLPA
ncbi:ORF6N domain-containing protein [Providencia sp. R33]|uniref:ORF6N domain-containing protein n=1 Tax=Providencia sp. R33 TaxID=2828763 RepID=UPI001C5AFBA2|nr:ORF6N domain-containing protein [Providencia sp. R33]QXX82954.1 ORF6N domain-containing protein [Providencia sp. R33]